MEDKIFEMVIESMKQKLPSDGRIMELAHEFMAEDNELLNINNNFSVEELQASAEFITDFGIWLKSQLTKQPIADKYLSTLPDDKQHFSFDDREPEPNACVSLVWEDGSNCECIYTGLVMTILPLPTHWHYVKSLPDEKEECEWEKEENFEYFATQCGEAYCLDGTIEENNHKYCPFCGKKIQLKKKE